LQKIKQDQEPACIKTSPKNSKKKSTKKRKEREGYPKVQTQGARKERVKNPK